MSVSLTPEHASRELEFGIYRDGDNNLDAIQNKVLAQARIASANDPRLQFNVEDTTSQPGLAERPGLHTEEYDIADGVTTRVDLHAPQDMAARQNLAAFVEHTLDEAEHAGVKQTWVDLVDHGGADAGGLEADHGSFMMRGDDIAGAIADGVREHATLHPEDAGRAVDGVVANQCLMATLGFSSALSHAGVKLLAASPETMLAPGVPSKVAEDIVSHMNDPQALGRAMVGDVMRTRYGSPATGTFGTAAAFDLIDLDAGKQAAVASAVKVLNGDLVAASRNPRTRVALHDDAATVDGMVRFDHRADGVMPYEAERPAMAVYDAFAQDATLDPTLRADAQAAENAVAATVIAHREAARFAPFGGSDYRDAAGPTVHFPVTRGTVDPWAPRISETDNAFYKSVGGAAVARALA